MSMLEIILTVCWACTALIAVSWMITAQRWRQSSVNWQRAAEAWMRSANNWRAQAERQPMTCGVSLDRHHPSDYIYDPGQ